MLSIFQFLTLGAYPWAKVRQNERRPTIHLDLPSNKISARSRKRSTRYALPNFIPLFGLVGANPWAKVHLNGRRPGSLLDLPPCEISSPYVNPRPRYPLPRYQSPADKQTNKQTVNDISTTCLSACVDNKKKHRPLTFHPFAEITPLNRLICHLAY